MGRGRQKAKQTKIARKLKYLTTDTDYNQLQKELSSQGLGESETDKFESGEQQFGANEDAGKVSEVSELATSTADQPSTHDDLDDYARWAAEAAAKATSGEMPAIAKRRKPIPIPVPAALSKHKPMASAKAAKSDTVSSQESDQDDSGSPDESAKATAKVLKKTKDSAGAAAKKAASAAKKKVATAAKKTAKDSKASSSGGKTTKATKSKAS